MCWLMASRDLLRLSKLSLSAGRKVEHMIHYKIDREKLQAEIEKEQSKDKWWGKAYREFKKAIDTQTHDKKCEYWTEIKGAYIRLQHNKCAYCERPMAKGIK